MVAAGTALLVSAGVLSGCSLLQGPPDREETFSVAGGECTAWWWLGQLQNGVPGEAETVAAAALDDADVSVASREEWESILASSYADDDIDVTEAELEGQAHIEVMRARVRSDLESAGYPDSNRVIEVWSDLRCN
jgi:hypothetical protein